MSDTDNYTPGPIGIDAIAVQGFKSLPERRSIDICPITILAGANSSGKSSIVQPVLLMKQTLDASTADPGSLLLDGPNVRFTSPNQFISRARPQDLHVEIATDDELTYGSLFSAAQGGMILMKTTIAGRQGGPIEFHLLNQDARDVRSFSKKTYPELFAILDRVFPDAAARIRHRRCFLDVDIVQRTGGVIMESLFTDDVADALSKLIHVPGLRGPRRRLYPQASASSPIYAGSFENYVGAVIADWIDKDDPRIHELTRCLRDLQMTNAVTVARFEDKFDVQIGRLATTDSISEDMVSVADVGVGVSQVLPVLVSCLVAREKQVVYIEQPELHLHPKAQYELARIIVYLAMSSGARVVIETHSSLFLRGIQTMIAADRLDVGAVRLHWFTRNAEGITTISTGELDEFGAFGNWPADFGDVELDATDAYLDARDERRRRKRKS